MDPRTGRLIAEANEIIQYLKKDFVFSSSNPGDSNENVCVHVTSRSLRVDSLLPLAIFKDKLIILRKLMYEDPSKASVLEINNIILEACSQSENVQQKNEKTSDTKNETATGKAQLNLNNCSSSFASKCEDNPNKNDTRGNVHQTDEKTSDVIITSIENLPVKNLHRENTSEKKNNVTSAVSDQWKPKEYPRKKSFKRFTNSHQEQSSKCDPAATNYTISKEINERSPDTELIFKICSQATAIVNKNFQENKSEIHFCQKSLECCSNLLNCLEFFKSAHVSKSSTDIHLNSIQAITDLNVLSFTLSNIIHSQQEQEDSGSNMLKQQSLELFNSTQVVIDQFSDLWKVLSNQETAALDLHINILSKSLNFLIENVGVVTLNFNCKCPQSSMIPMSVRQTFISGCDRAMFLKIETNLKIINHCSSLLEAEVNVYNNSDANQIKVTLLMNIFRIISLIKQLIVVVKQIEDELRNIYRHPASDEILVNLYNQDVNIYNLTTKLATEVDILTKSSVLMMSAADITILTLKRVSKNVSQIEETSKQFVSSCTNEEIEDMSSSMMTQEQIEAMMEVQSMIENCSLEIREHLLDGISFGMSDRNNNKSDFSSPLPNTNNNPSMIYKPVPKRVLPATPREQLKQPTYTQMANDQPLLRQHTDRSPTDTSGRTKFQKRFSMIHPDQMYGEKFDHVKIFNSSNSGKNVEKSDDVEAARGAVSQNNSNNVAVLRKNPNLHRYYAHRHSFMQ